MAQTHSVTREILWNGGSTEDLLSKWLFKIVLVVEQSSNPHRQCAGPRPLFDPSIRLLFVAMF